MNMTTDRSHQNPKSGRFSFLFEEWTAQLVLVVAVIGVLVERTIAISGGTIGVGPTFAGLIGCDPSMADQP